MSKKIVIKIEKQEFDYDKLADAIVNAEKKVETQNIEEKQKIGLFKTIGMIIANKGDTYDRMTIGAFTFLLELFFRLVSLFVFSVTTIYSGKNIFQKLDGFLTANCFGKIEIIFCVLLVVAVWSLVTLFCILLWGTGNEVEKEKDKNYIMTVFSVVTGFVALIVSFIALILGVT